METRKHETYVSLEVAKLLKQAGFNWNINSCYNCYGIPILSTDMGVYSNYNEDKNIISAPTLTVAQKWLREVKGWDIDIITNREHIGIFYECDCIDKNVRVFKPQSGKDITPFLFDTYEEALAAGIKNCLELILEEDE